MSDEKDTLFNLKAQLSELEAFLKTKLYSSFRRTYEADVNACKETILVTVPNDAEAVTFLLTTHEKKVQLLAASNFFEEALSTLKQRISDLEDAETKATDNNNQ